MLPNTMKFKDRLYDAVFDYIDLTEVEVKVIQTPVFQRLHHIKQLGMANIVFPSAVHTRFGHSLGVMHIMHKMVCHLRRNYQEMIQISDEDHQVLRLAALLHDVGHLPFSHVGEAATESVSDKKATDAEVEMVTPDSPDGSTIEDFDTPRKPLNSKLHEMLSKRIVENWRNVRDILQEYKCDPATVGRIIVGGSDLYQTMLLHSELDADRLDYLLRDSNFLGVSYGNIELDHIVSMLGCGLLEGERAIGVKEKGLHAVEHYLLARYFMYSQIIFSPSIFYLESILRSVYECLVESRDEDVHLFSADELTAIIDHNDHHKFYDFNDHLAYCNMRRLHNKLDAQARLKANDPVAFITNENTKVLLSGNIPKPMIVKKAFIDQKTKKKTESYKRSLSTKVKDACDELEIHPKAVIYDFLSTKLTKARSSYSPDEPLPGDVRDEAIRIIDSDLKFKYLVENEATLLGSISNNLLQCFYLFVNPLILKRKGIDESKARDVFKRHIDVELVL
ncbi:MAG: HD domain-containing protein [Deltaproteobacteria bacterium]|nr:HD domain-containing protein [Deltaproteobacteria bacterium]